MMVFSLLYVNGSSSTSIAERIILVHNLPVDVVPCGAGDFLHLKLVIFEVMITFLDFLALGNPRMIRKSHLTVKFQAL